MVMHENGPSHNGAESQSPPEPPPQYAARPVVAPPDPKARRSWGRNAGGAAVGIGLLAAKFKSALLLLASLKWLAFAAKFGLSFGSIFASVWVYATAFGGLKLGIVFVLLLLVHEMGHWVVLRGYGVPVSLPYLIPGLGAFVAQKAPTKDNVQDAMSALAGPAVGIAASALCHVYGNVTGSEVWIWAAHIGYLINLFNLIPVLPLDGGRVAGSVDPRLLVVGIALFVALALAGVLHGVSFLILGLVALVSIPRAIAAWRGVIDPRVAASPWAVRGGIAAAYFAVIVLAILGYAHTDVLNPAIAA